MTDSYPNRDMGHPRRAIPDQAETRARFQALWDTADDAILIVDPAGIVRDANPAYSTLTGFARSAIVGQPYTRVYPAADAARALADYVRTFTMPTPLPPFERTLSRPDGTLLHVETHATFIMRGATRTAMLCLIRDSTARSQATTERTRLLEQEQAARRAAERAQAEAEATRAHLAILAEASTVLMTTLDDAEHMHAVAALMVHYLTDWCQITIINDQTGQIEPVAVAGPDPGLAQQIMAYARRNPLNPAAPTGVPQAIHTGQMQIIPTVTDALIAATITDPHYAQVLRACHFGQTYILPLTARGRTFGAITFALTTDSTHAFTPENVALAEELTQRAALALDNARLYHDGQRQLRRHRAMTTTLTAVIHAPDQATALTAVVHSLVDALGSTSGAIYAYHPTDNTLTLLSQVGYHARLPPSPILRLLDFPHTQEALTTGHPVLVTAQSTSPFAAAVMHEHAVTTVLLVPFTAGDQAIGMAYVTYADPTRQPTPDDVAFAQGMATHCAVALDKARLVEDARRERARLETVLDIAPVGITVWDSTGQVLQMNTEARTHANQPSPPREPFAAEVPFAMEYADGRPLPPDATPIARVLHGEMSAPELYRLRYPDGREREVIATARAAPDGYSVIGVSQDVTALQQALRASHTAQIEIAALKEADALKTRVLRVVAHELRAPLTGIMGFAELLTLRASDPQTVTDYAGKIVLSAERMRTLVQDYLDLERLAAGGEGFTSEPVAIRAVIDAACAVVNPSQHPLHIDVGPEKTVWADANKLRRVLVNLLTNAAKYSADGQPIHVTVSRVQAMVRIAVIDHGPGIPREAQPHIFETFYRVKSDDPLYNQPGTGLGLAISQEIMTRMNGEIGFESSPTGTTFWVRLPRVDKAHAAQPTAPPPPLPETPTTYREDEE